MENNQPAVRLEKDGQIALIILNSPEKLNVFNVDLRDQLYETILAIRDDPTIDAAVLCGAGRGFCAGGDLTEFGTETPVVRKRRIRIQRDIWEEIRRLKKPIAAALHGFAVGAGLEMSMLCDFRFAAPETILALPETQLGMIAAAGGTQSLPRLVYQGMALELALTGKRITVEEGLELGLITRIAPKDELIDTTVSFMKNIVERNPKTAKWIKSLVSNGLDMQLSQGLARERVLVARSWG